MTIVRPGPAGQRRLWAGLATITAPCKRPFPLTVVWRWRYELAVAVTITGAVTALLQNLGLEWGTVAATGLAALLGPPWPEPVARWGWRVVTPHRLRAGFDQARIRTAHGRLPAILRTTSAPFGERVRVWCPAGISAADLQEARDVLCAACWAADIRISRDELRAHIVTVDVIRRPAPEPEPAPD